MEFGIERVDLFLNRQKSGRVFLPLEQIQETEYGRNEDGLTAKLTLENRESCVLLRIEVILKCGTVQEKDLLEREDALTVTMSLKEKPVCMTAINLWKDWWTRPEFVKSWEELPERTQCIFVKYEYRYGCLMFLAGKKAKALAKGGEKDRLCVRLSAFCGGLSEIREPLFVWAEGKTVFEAVRKCARAAAEEAGVPLREQRRFPEIFEKLGWCTWNAFYTDISEEKVLLKMKELVEKNVPVRWVLLDDGWLSVREKKMYDFRPDEKKFPEGFSRMISEIKEESTVEQVGVWHAIGGYWGGIEPGSPLHEQEKENLYRTGTGKLWPYPDAGKGYRFYLDWYELLRREGIDFLKVDVQSSVKNCFKDEFPVGQAANQLHKALEGAAAAYMDGRLINCMGMGMENILNRPGSAISRNSDDFVPENPDGFAEHLLQNAFNTVYHDEFYYCDWDMFWTCHKDAQKHALLRAVSGGPVYFSDRIGDTDPEVLLPLIKKDGRILRMDRGAKPTEDCIFEDPLQNLLCLTNIGRYGAGDEKGGALLLCNLSEDVREREVSPSDIYDLPEGSYYCYDRRSGTGRVLGYRERMSLSVAPGELALCLLLPVTEEWTIVGMTEKYISFLAVEQLGRIQDGFWALTEESGDFAFYSRNKVMCCTVDGKDSSSLLKEKDGLYRLPCDGEGRHLIVVSWKE